MRRVSVSILGVLAMVLASLAFTPSIQAAEPGFTITPSDGDRLLDWDRSYTVTANAVAPGAYTAIVTQNGDYISERDFFIGSEGAVVDFKFRLFSEIYQDNLSIAVFKDGSPNTPLATSNFYVEGFPNPRLISPEPQVQMGGANFSALFNFTDSRPGTFEIHLYSDTEGDFGTKTFVYDPTTKSPIREFKWKIYAPGTYNLYVTAEGNAYGSYRFEVSRPINTIITSVSRTTFYPTVRDGFKDDTTIKFQVSRPSTSRLTIKNSRNRVVDSRDFNTKSVGTKYAFTWNGRGVEPGKYTVSLKSKDNEYPTSDTSTREIFVKTDFVNEQETESAKGTQTSSRSKSGPCYFSGYAGELSIDCWGFFERASAEARYGFRIPSNATNLRYSMRGLVKCCDGGIISKGIKRTSATNAYVYVRLTGSRAYDVRKVSLTYNYKRKR